VFDLSSIEVLVIFSFERVLSMALAAGTLKTSTNCFCGNDTRSLLLMASALGLRDRYTHAHAHRVAAYSKRLAIRVGLSMQEVMQVTMGGMLHDVGKLVLSDRIFSNQKAALSEEMLWEVRNHPLIGAALLQKVTCGKAISDAVLFHHERMDGLGYPFGLKGDAIPLSAKIVSIADCFDAVTTDRPYQRRKSCKAAFSLLEEVAGTRYSGEMIPIFIDEIRCNGMARQGSTR
jgi:HD-GYP domain-containing protein (c-di-GMP phosphodiesterase class II)